MTISRMRKIVWRRMAARRIGEDVPAYFRILTGREEIPDSCLDALFERCLRGKRPRTRHGWIARCKAMNDQSNNSMDTAIARLDDSIAKVEASHELFGISE